MTFAIDATQLAALAQWLSEHSQQLPQLLSDLEALRAATNINDFWTAFKTAGDLLVPWLEDCPLVAPPAADAQNASPVSIDLGPIINALPQLISLIQAILAAFQQTGGGQPQPAA
ncbi:MAG TPA: hypothetical protein VHY20_04000 [Pirellulales bacterium]|jgi:hypothetical protein|nr:hypothetical protein [Pirellulales bacterium]